VKPSARSQKKAADIAAERAQLRFSLAAARGPYCQYPGCSQPFSDLHEVLTRGRGGDPTDPENILLLCREHHKFVTEHEHAARELGLVRARTAEEHRALFRPWEATP
jgi:hypothetical protein